MAPPDAAKPAPDLPGNGTRNIDCLAAVDVSKHNQIAGNAQAQIERSPAITAAIQRAKQRLLGIKRGSLWTITDEASARLDEVKQSLEDSDDEAMLAHGKRFIENARAFAKLLRDFRDTRRASQ